MIVNYFLASSPFKIDDFNVEINLLLGIFSPNFVSKSSMTQKPLPISLLRYHQTVA